MALKNGKSLKTTLKIFFKENARYPEFEEFRKLIKGESGKSKQTLDSNEEKKESHS